MRKTGSPTRYHNKLAAVWVAMALLCAVNRVSAQSPQLPELLQELHSTQDSSQYVNTLGKLGALYMMIDIDSSFVYAIRAHEIADRLHDKKGLADAYDVMSFCFALRTDFNIAGIYAYQALQLHKSLSDSARMCKTLSNLYLYYRNMGRPVEANNYFYEAFNMARRLPPWEDSTYSILLVNYAMRFYNDANRKDSVQWAFRTARRISEKYSRSRLPLYIDAYEADTLVKQGHGKEAEVKMNQLATEALQRGLPYVAMDIYNRLENYLGMGYAIDSTHYRELSYELAKKAGCIELNLATIAGLYDYYQTENDTGKVNYYSSEIMRMAGQHRYHQDRDMVNYVDYFLKEQALQQLSRSNLLQQAELEKRSLKKRNSQFVMAGLFVIVILLFILLVSRYRQFSASQVQERELSDSYADISLKSVALRANDEFKNKLITIIANDFRAPLYYISNVAGRLKDYEDDPATLTALIKKIADVSSNTLSVFDNILKWIRLQLAGFTYHPVSCSLHTAMQAVLKPTAAAIAEKSLLLVNLLPEDFTLPADAEMLRMVQLHLLRLSIHYAQRGSLLIISAWKSEGLAYTRIIAYTGADAAAIIKTLSDWQQDMYALSYAITKDFIDKMNGVIQVTESEGKYLVFTGILKG
jgi:signal transduction histidine kinase